LWIDNNRQMKLYSTGCMENNKHIKLYYRVYENNKQIELYSLWAWKITNKWRCIPLGIFSHTPRVIQLHLFVIFPTPCVIQLHFSVIVHTHR
jgi:hypothetical protein